MNKTNLKRYAPQARKDFIAAVTARAQLLGLTEVAGQPHAAPCQVNGDVAVIAGRPWPASVQGKRDRLLQRMNRDGFAATLEAVAYTWFNRFAALRYMELHDFLGHGRRVLSNPDGALPEVLSHAVELAEAGDLPGLQVEQVRQLKLDNQDGELFRRVLIAQCNALHGAMPFLFEAIDDETELLLPDNLLLSDSVVAKLVAEIPEEDWVEVEAIGWLYQFYISEKKDQVIGKVVKSEDIPAATQLFTPNWIVQYLVQNSVGRLWLMANPSSTLASQWPYYIQPAEQTPEVQAQLDALIQTRIDDDGGSLNPETITVLDPACGSGHILLVAYDVLKDIYLERGYQPRAIPRLILEMNLFGLDIDDRAAQLAAFALLMKARADDRRLFNDPPKLNVLSLQESKGLDADELATHLSPFGLQRATLKALVDTFEHAKAFGSLIQIPAELNGRLAAMTVGLSQALQDGDLYARQAANEVLPMVWQAMVQGMHFDAVVANPPYMGNKAMNSLLRDFAGRKYPSSRTDLFAMFIEKGLDSCKPSGKTSMVTMDAWMFAPAYLDFRERILREVGIVSMPHFGSRAFDSISGEVVSTVAFSLDAITSPKGRPVFLRLVSGRSESEKNRMLLSQSPRYVNHTQESFFDVSGSPLAYWLSEGFLHRMKDWRPLKELAEPRSGLTTGDNEKFLRLWFEVAGFNSTITDIEYGEDVFDKWVPLNGGSDFRKWYGSNDYVIYWEGKGASIRNSPAATMANPAYQFKPGVTWSKISGSTISVRRTGAGFVFSAVGLKSFPKSSDINLVCGLLNSKIVEYLVPVFSSNLTILSGDIAKYPVADGISHEVSSNVDVLCDIARKDWDSRETSWDFLRNPLVAAGCINLEAAFNNLGEIVNSAVTHTRQLEERNNELLIAAYDLVGELSPDVPDTKITLGRVDREKDSQRLISFAIGCLMGRYSLDEPGLVYAQAGNVGFDPSRYEKIFPADTDGIVPVTDDRWFEDDAASRVREFLCAVWGPDTLDENMTWLAESLGIKGSETPDETVRRYLADKFFKDHLQTYKKRPIYWLFSSGKQGAFQALVYLHRYHEGTLARMRSEYVLPLTGKMQARMESLEVDIRQASSTAARNKLTKQLEALRKQHHELLAYDEKLRHYADQRIAIDLDDGVKVNYGKFGDLLAEVKAVTGGAGDE